MNLGITKTSAENRIAVFVLKVVASQAQSAVARVERDRCSVVASQAESAVARVERDTCSVVASQAESAVAIEAQNQRFYSSRSF